MKETPEKKSYCPICRGPVEETGKPAWAYCPVHGWVKYGSHDKPETSDLLSKINLKATILAKQAEEKFVDVRRRSPLLRYVVPAIFITVVLGFSVGYFLLRDTLNNGRIVKEIATQSQSNKQPAIQPQARLAGKELVALNEQKEELKENEEIKPPKQTTQKKKESGQTQKPLKQLFAVQAGVFQNPSHAKTLKEMLRKKGYDVTIITLKTEKGATLHKVRVGKFKDRKSAEHVAKKMRTEDGIQQAFVTAE